MNRTTSAINIKYVVIAVLASFVWIACVAMYFYSSKELLPGQTANVLLPAPPEIRLVKQVDRGIFEQEFKLSLTFDDGSRLSGIATSKVMDSELSWISGELLAELLTDHTGVLWMPVDTSDKDHKKEWTSTLTEKNDEKTLSVRFKIYAKK